MAKPFALCAIFESDDRVSCSFLLESVRKRALCIILAGLRIATGTCTHQPLELEAEVFMTRETGRWECQNCCRLRMPGLGSDSFDHVRVSF